MEDDFFLGYVELHSQTERALFSGRDVIRFFDLAGEEPPPVYTSSFYAMFYDEILPLLEEAQEKVARKKRISNSHLRLVK